MLEKYQLEEYINLIEGIKSGDYNLFNEAIE